MNLFNLKRACIVLICGVFFCTVVFASEPLHRDINGQWVPFDREANPGYDEGNAHDVVYYPNKKSPAFSVSYQDVTNGNGIGFDDATLGAQRRARVVDSLNYIAAVLSEESGSADIHFNVSQTDGTGALASCGSSFWVSNGYQGGFVYDHIKTGVDPYSGGPDATATFDFGWNWYTGTGLPGSNQIDLRSVVLHEVTHALGFNSLISYPSGNSAITNSNPGGYSYYDANLANGNGLPFCNSSGGASFIRTASDLLGQNNGVMWIGPEGVAEYGNNPPIYAPSFWQSGSSISHWANSTPGGTVMRPAIGDGVVRRVYQDFEIASLVDIGYTITLNPPPVPAAGPAGILLLVGVLGLMIGVSVRGRKH